MIGTGPIKYGAGVAGGQGGNLGGEKIAEQAAPMVEAQVLAVFRCGVAGGASPTDGRALGGRFRAEDYGGGAIAKETGADENAGIVVEITGGRTDFHADHEDPASAARLELGGGLIQGREGSPAALTDEIEQRG